MMQIDLAPQRDERAVRDVAFDTDDPGQVRRRQFGRDDPNGSKPQRQAPMGLRQDRPPRRPDQGGVEALLAPLADALERHSRSGGVKKVDRQMHQPPVDFVEINDVVGAGTGGVVATPGAMFAPASRARASRTGVWDSSSSAAKAVATNGSPQPKRPDPANAAKAVRASL